MSAPNFLAGGTIYPCRFVFKNADPHEVEQAASAITPLIGISQEGTHDTPGLSGAGTDAASDGEQLHVYTEGDECLLEVVTTVAAGNRLKSDADGKGTPLLGTETAAETFVGAIALDDGAAGEKIRVQVKIYSVRPA
jgi:hypothetical protein